MTTKMLYMKTFKYLADYQPELKKRPCIVETNKQWFEHCRPRVVDWFTQDKIVTPNLSAINNFCVDFGENKAKQYLYIDHDCYGITLKDKDRSNYLYLLGILNSSIVQFFIRQISPMFSGGYYKYHTQYLDQVPIIDAKNEVQKKLKETIIAQVKRILDLNQELNSMNELTDKGTGIREKIERIDKDIDIKVYELYGLTVEDRKIIEASFK